MSVKGPLAVIDFDELLNMSIIKSEFFLLGFFHNTFKDMALSMSKFFNREKFGTPTIVYMGKLDDLFDNGFLFLTLETPANLWEPYKATSLALPVISPNPSSTEKFDFLDGRHRTNAFERSSITTADLFIVCEISFFYDRQKVRDTAYRRSILVQLVAESITDVLSGIPSHVNDIDVF